MDSKPVTFLTPAQIGKLAEAKFEQMWKDAYGKQAFVHRLPDTKQVRQARGGSLAHLPKQPSDYVVTALGVTHYAEVKGTANKVGFPFSNLEPSQRNGITRQIEAGGLYYLYVYSLMYDQWYRLEGREIKALQNSGINSLDFNKGVSPWNIKAVR
jgi:penicillin-binding protein-related factor A (putative recombinase)